MSMAAMLLVVVMTAFGLQANAQSITPCSTSVNVANFGLDGDMSANTPGSLVGTNDDWFQNSAFPGAGQGIIGTSAATSPNGISAADFKALIQGASLIGRNRTYVQRMAVPNLTPRFITPTTGYILLDAVAARDNHTAGGAVDSSAFAGGPDKNGANPQTWTIGVAGVQQKNDLIDVGGHIRREFNFATGAGGALWGYAFATTRNTSGDAPAPTFISCKFCFKQICCNTIVIIKFNRNKSANLIALLCNFKCRVSGKILGIKSNSCAC